MGFVAGNIKRKSILGARAISLGSLGCKVVQVVRKVNCMVAVRDMHGG